ncbi:MAG: ribonuclease H-like domain-containing protein [Actinobacteria bacterium]|nr:ribonuclease H-like domain-containing protein [Actinomycetota bacterium]
MEQRKVRKKRVCVPRHKVNQIIELLMNEDLKRAYLDIETDESFNPTLVGIYIKEEGFRRLVRPNIKAETIHRLLDGVEVVITYNGERFDLDILERFVGFRLSPSIQSLDLMYMCWELDLYGGLKKVEKELGIIRDSTIEGMNGLDAVNLWNEYEMGDKKALSLLELYNYYDVMNLVELENRLRRKILEEYHNNMPDLGFL